MLKHKQSKLYWNIRDFRTQDDSNRIFYANIFYNDMTALLWAAVVSRSIMEINGNRIKSEKVEKLSWCYKLQTEFTMLYLSFFGI